MNVLPHLWVTLLVKCYDVKGNEYIGDCYPEEKSGALALFRPVCSVDSPKGIDGGSRSSDSDVYLTR